MVLLAHNLSQEDINYCNPGGCLSGKLVDLYSDFVTRCLSQTGDFKIIKRSVSDDLKSIETAEQHRHELENFKFLLVPVSDSDGPNGVTRSWSLLTVEIQDNQLAILHYDSRRRGHSELANKIGETISVLLQKDLKINQTEENKNSVLSGFCPKTENVSDSGIYVLCIMEILAKMKSGISCKSLSSILAKHIKKFRNSLSKSLNVKNI